MPAKKSAAPADVDAFLAALAHPQDATLQRLRAASVGNYLIGQGLQRERFEIVGMGKRYPVASNDTDAGRALNRRVEIRVLPVRS